MRSLILAISFLATALSFGQDVLSYDDFLLLVKEFHPEAQLAQLQSDKGTQLEKAARGNFDPVLSSKVKEKYFQDKSYYNLYSADITLPTISGITVSGGYTNNTGKFLNPQNYTPSDGTGYLGVSIPLGKGMFTDENRAGLQIAKQQKEQYEQLSQLTLNDLLFEASTSYWDWYLYHNTMLYLDSAVSVSAKRLDFVRKQFLVGESAANDTLKAFVQFQDRNQSLFDAERNRVKSFLVLNTFLWDDSLGLKPTLTPLRMNANSFPVASDTISPTHPTLRYYDAKILEYTYYKRLKAEKLKPKLNLDYTLLYPGAAPQFNDLGNSQLWGLSLEFPLLIRTERADYKMAKIKISESELMRNQKERQITNKLKTEQAQLNVLMDQVLFLDNSLLAYDKLIKAERLKFRLGENSLFELNNWEQKQIENQLKYLKLQSKANITQAKIQWISADWR